MDSPALEYVGFWLRVWAFIIDSALSSIVLLPIMFIGTDVEGLVLETIVTALVVIIFWAARQATPGKMAISATIVDAETGKRPTTGQFIGRYFGYYVSLIPFGLGLIWVGIDARKQGWHDKLAGTVVVRPRRGAAPVAFKAS